jgi:release factor glutamine methyltransferase
MSPAATVTLKSMLNEWQSRLAEAEDESEISALFQYCCEELLGYTRSELLLKPDSELSGDEVTKLYAILEELERGRPVQQILGYAWFDGMKLYVNEHVLIPRPETEELCALAESLSAEISSQPLIIDYGTGSGCIALSMKKRCRQAQVIGVDVSAKAIETAKKNAVAQQLEVSFRLFDLFENEVLKELPAAELIISNPPYVLRSEAGTLREKVMQHEPHLALFVEDTDPALYYKRLMEIARHQLKPGGYFISEINPLAMDSLQSINSNDVFSYKAFVKDLQGKFRFMVVRKIR